MPILASPEGNGGGSGPIGISRDNRGKIGGNKKGDAVQNSTLVQFDVCTIAPRWAMTLAATACARSIEWWAERPSIRLAR